MPGDSAKHPAQATTKNKPSNESGITWQDSAAPRCAPDPFLIRFTHTLADIDPNGPDLRTKFLRIACVLAFSPASLDALHPGWLSYVMIRSRNRDKGWRWVLIFT